MASHRSALFQPTFGFPMVAVCVLVAGFLIYYFPITDRQKASLNRRAFRSLAAVSDGLGSRIVNYVEVLEQTAKQSESRRAAAGSPGGPGADFVVTEGEGRGDCKAKDVTVETAPRDGSRQTTLQCGRWVGTVNIERLVSPYLRETSEQLFDEVVLTDASGAVLYQSIKTGSRFNSIQSAAFGTESGPDRDSAAATSGGPNGASITFAAASQSSTLVSATVAGENYRLYIVPVPLKLPSAAPQATQLVLVGLMRTSRFQAASMAVPGTAVITAILLVMVVMVATWPLLKFATMGATERIPRRSAVYLYLSTVATIILLCILAIHVRYVVDRQDIDTNLKRLATSIEHNLQQELSMALRVLDSANNSPLLEASTKLPGDDECRTALSTATKTAQPTITGLLAKKQVRLSDYPYFDRIFWTDSLGFQHIKWEAGPSTPATYVGDRAYFVETMANRLWQFAPPNEASSRFRVDTVLSRNTGEYRAVISQKAPPVPICGAVTLGVVSMVTPLLSLVDPIMPPDYGFAVVDGAGQVLFHSSSTKNGRERFLDEVDDDAELRTALFARQGKLLTAQYLGVDHRLFVMPLTVLQQSAWSLILLHNLSESGAQHLGRIVMFSLLAFVYAMALTIVLLAMPVARGPQAWMWPRSEHRGSYIHLAATMVLMTPTLYLLIFAVSNAGTVLLVAGAIPILMFATAVLKLKPVHPLLPRATACLLLLGFTFVLIAEPMSKGYLAALFAGLAALLLLLSMQPISDWLASRSWPSLTDSYTALWACSLTAVALLPCIALFRVAYDYEGNLSTRRKQVQTMAALAEREERVKAQYGRRELTAPENGASLDVARWLFVRRRLDQTIDRYDAVLTRPDSGQLFSQSTGHGPESSCDDELPAYLQALAALDPYGKAALSRTLTRPSADRPFWRWCRDGVNRLRLVGQSEVPDANREALSLPATRALFTSVASAPLFLHAELVSELPVLKAWWLPVPMLALGATALIAFLWMRPTIRQLFLLDVPPTAPLPEMELDGQIAVTENLILLTSDPGAASAALRQRTDLMMIDKSTFAETEADVQTGAYAAVVIDQFDYRNDNDDVNRKKLELLERLSSRQPSMPVVIVTAVDPVFFFGTDSHMSSRPSLEVSASGQDMERWAAALARFRRVRLTAPPTGSPAEQGRRMWSTCTTAERVTLYQLAHDGWVNPKCEAALHQLVRRGVIADRPVRFTDPKLEAFVSHNISRSDRKAWRQQDEAGVWVGIRHMFVVLILGVAAVALFVSQQSVLGLVATGLGILTPLTKLLSEAHSFRSLVGLSPTSPKAQ